MSSVTESSQLNEANFLQQLLEEQADLTAVERFSVHHETVAESAEPAQARYYRALLPATPPGPEQQYAFEVDLDACSGCKACVVACHTLNGLEEHESWRQVGIVTVGRELPQIKHVTSACHHCAEPGCLHGCPVLAYDKDAVTGIVRHLDDQCIGCKYCTMMCPYEVPQYNERLGIVRKCDMCHQRLRVGEAPACVQACPNAAIAIRSVPRESHFTADARLAPGAPRSTITRPSTRYTGSNLQHFAGGTPQNAGVDHPHETHLPLVILLIATQVSVGLLCCERLVAGIGWLGGVDAPPSQTVTSVTAAWVCACVGMLIAPLHLGQPLRAWRVFLGLRTSWLSREAVLLGKYTGLLSLAMLLLVEHPYAPRGMFAWQPPDWLTELVLAGAVCCGIAGLYSSAMIYIVTHRAVWRAARTLPCFFGTAAIGGLLLAGGIAASSITVATGLVLAMIKLSWEWRTHLGPPQTGESDLARRSRRLTHEALGVPRRMRLTVGWLSCLIVACGMVPLALAPSGGAMGVVLCGAAGVLVGELFERLLYFSSVVYDRMPGALR